MRLATSGSGLVERDSADTSDAADAPTVEADNAATGLRQWGKPGGNHRQCAAASTTAGIRRAGCRCARLRTDCRAASDH